MLIREPENLLTSQQVSWLEMDQLDCDDDLWSCIYIHVYTEGDVRTSLATEEGEASPQGAGR